MANTQGYNITILDIIQGILDKIMIMGSATIYDILYLCQEQGEQI